MTEYYISALKWRKNQARHINNTKTPNKFQFKQMTTEYHDDREQNFNSFRKFLKMTKD